MTSVLLPPTQAGDDDAPPPRVAASVVDLDAPPAVTLEPAQHRSDPHAGAIRPTATRPVPTRTSRTDRAARALLLQVLGGLRHGRLTIVEPDGTATVHGVEPEPDARNERLHRASWPTRDASRRERL